MGKKRAFEDDESHDAGGSGVGQAPIVRSRRERAVKARLRSGGDETPSSHTDSDSGIHFNPTNIAESLRNDGGEDLQDSQKRRDSKSSKLYRRSRAGRPIARSLEPRTKRASGGIFKTAAIRILTEAGSLLTSGAIYDRAMQQGLVNESAGKTPEATMAAALYTDIKKYRNQSTFIKPREGLFGLREWINEECSILTSADRAEIARDSEDSVAEVSGTSFPSLQPEREPTPRQKRSKQQLKSKRHESRQRRLSKPKGPVNTSAPRQTRSHSVPPSAREEAAAAAQPTLSEPQAVFANERLQALFMAVDQVSGSTATSNPASLTASLTESEEDPSVKLSVETLPETGSARVSLEPDGESAPMPALSMVKSEEQEPAELPQPAQIGEDRTATALEIQQGLVHVPKQEPFAQPAAENPAEPSTRPAEQQSDYDPTFSMGECLTAEDRLAALERVDAIERQLQSLDQTDKTDPQVGNCHMQLSSLYLSLGHREKAVQSYVIALEQCEAMLT